MAIVFLDCQRGSLRLTQMMSLDVKMLEKKLFTVWSQSYELRKEPFWGWYKKLPPYTILHAIYLLCVSTLGPPLDQQEIARFPNPLTSGLSSQLRNPKSMKCISYLEPSWVHLSPLEYQWHWICCKSRLSRIHLSSPWPAGEGWDPTQLELWSCFAKEWVANRGQYRNCDLVSCLSIREALTF